MNVSKRKVEREGVISCAKADKWLQKPDNMWDGGRRPEGGAHGPGMTVVPVLSDEPALDVPLCSFLVSSPLPTFSLPKAAQPL